MLWLQLRFDYDTTTTYRMRLLPIRRKQKMNMSIFRRSRIVVVSQSNRNCDRLKAVCTEMFDILVYTLLAAVDY